MYSLDKPAPIKKVVFIYFVVCFRFPNFPGVSFFQDPSLYRYFMQNLYKPHEGTLATILMNKKTHKKQYTKMLSYFFGNTKTTENCTAFRIRAMHFSTNDDHIHNIFTILLTTSHN